MKKKSAKKPRVTNEMLWEQLTIALGKLKASQEWQSKHEMDDNNRFEAGVSKEEFERVAAAVLNPDGTAKMDDMLATWQEIEKGAIIVQKGGKWSLKALLVVATVVTALTAIFGGWKTVIGLFIGRIGS